MILYSFLNIRILHLFSLQLCGCGCQDLCGCEYSIHSQHILAAKIHIICIYIYAHHMHIYIYIVWIYITLYAYTYIICIYIHYMHIYTLYAYILHYIERYHIQLSYILPEISTSDPCVPFGTFRGWGLSVTWECPNLKSFSETSRRSQQYDT